MRLKITIETRSGIALSPPKLQGPKPSIDEGARMTVRANQTTRLYHFRSIIPHEGKTLSSGEASGDASCSILTISGFSSFAVADLMALFFLAETGLSLEGEAARLRLLGFGVSTSAVAGALVESF